jgi:hypothetical protein
MERFYYYRYIGKPVFGILVGIVRALKNLRTPIDRAHRVVLGTGMERLEHLLKRIWEGFTRIPRRKTGILEFTRTWFELWKIREHQSIELIELYLEPGWNASNAYSNEYGKVLLNRYQDSYRKKLVFWNLL